MKKAGRIQRPTPPRTRSFRNEGYREFLEAVSPFLMGGLGSEDGQSQSAEVTQQLLWHIPDALQSYYQSLDSGMRRGLQDAFASTGWVPKNRPSVLPEIYDVFDELMSYGNADIDAMIADATGLGHAPPVSRKGERMTLQEAGPQFHPGLKDIATAIQLGPYTGGRGPVHYPLLGWAGLARGAIRHWADEEMHPLLVMAGDKWGTRWLDRYKKGDTTLYRPRVDDPVQVTMLGDLRQVSRTRAFADFVAAEQMMVDAGNVLDARPTYVDDMSSPFFNTVAASRPIADPMGAIASSHATSTSGPIRSTQSDSAMGPSVSYSQSSSANAAADSPLAGAYNTSPGAPGGPFVEPESSIARLPGNFGEGPGAFTGPPTSGTTPIGAFGSAVEGLFPQAEAAAVQSQGNQVRMLC